MCTCHAAQGKLEDRVAMLTEFRDVEAPEQQQRLEQQIKAVQAERQKDHRAHVITHCCYI